jgi:hypothetical protein
MAKRYRRELQDALVQAATASSPLVRRLSEDVQLRYRRRRRRKKRTALRIVTAGCLMLFATAVVIPAMIAAGFLLGPSATEGLIATPLILFTVYGSILYWAFGRKPALPPIIASAKVVNVAQLPAQTDDWLDQQRNFLPYAAQSKLDSIALRLEALAPQVQGMDSTRPGAAEMKRLLAEELPELVRGYLKLPRALRTQPLHGGASPEKQLVEGLGTIDEQIGRLQQQLAADDLKALATHQRYLDLKYKRDDELK